MNPLYLILTPLAAAILGIGVGKRAFIQQILALLVMLGGLGFLLQVHLHGFENSQISYPCINSFGIYFALSVTKINFWFLLVNVLWQSCNNTILLINLITYFMCFK